MKVWRYRKESKVFLFGRGAIKMIKGGTGSGDVNEREVVDFYAGLKAAGVDLINEQEILEGKEIYKKAFAAWTDSVKEKMRASKSGSGMEIFDIYITNPFEEPECMKITEKVKEADVVLYVLARIAGEGRDRKNEVGDYRLSDQEEQDLRELAKYTDRIVVMINSGGQIELERILANESIKGLLYVSQGGMEAGNAVADVLTGKVTPSGRLTSTWTNTYEEFPNAENYSHNNGNVEQEYYEEGIYVGYRYFESFGKKTAFPFGFGLSYADLSIQASIKECKKDGFTVLAKVENKGDVFSGKEVVQIYAACPQTEQKKELKRLVGFKKTKELRPKESDTLEIEIPAKALASYDEKHSEWVMEQGEYAIFAGNSSDHVTVIGVLDVQQRAVLEKVRPILPLQRELKEFVRPDEIADAFTKSWKQSVEKEKVEIRKFAPEKEEVRQYPKHPAEQVARKIAAELSDEELTLLLMGEVTKGQDSMKEDGLVETGIYVPGAAGETTCQLEEAHQIPAVSMADGPAGLRLLRNYEVDQETGLIHSQGFLASLDGGIFAEKKEHENAKRYYQYATAIPVGTMLAQTWDTQLLYEIGQMIGTEMQEFQVSWWLAPGLCIQRNPLCGRNFEYYSEDPLVSGVMAAAITRGVQSIPGVGTTIKHFACNNQEDNRVHSDSIVSERALREIYLRGFEIAVKTAQPMCIMTSYNLINGVHTANSADLCKECARKEWGFQGAIMTDWTTTSNGSISHLCAASGNDLIMPGFESDRKEILQALKRKELKREDAEEAAVHLMTVIFQTLAVEDARPYKEQFDF